MPRNLPNIPQCRDIFDEKFLLLAKVAKADYLVVATCKQERLDPQTRQFWTHIMALSHFW